MCIVSLDAALISAENMLYPIGRFHSVDDFTDETVFDETITPVANFLNRFLRYEDARDCKADGGGRGGGNSASKASVLQNSVLLAMSVCKNGTNVSTGSINSLLALQYIFFIANTTITRFTFDEFCRLYVFIQ